MLLLTCCADDFNAESDHDWYIVGQKAGLVRSVANFTFVQVYGAGGEHAVCVVLLCWWCFGASLTRYTGHMVPMDQPAHALNMLGKFLNDERFY